MAGNPLSRVRSYFRLISIAFNKPNFRIGDGYILGRGCTISKKNDIVIGDRFFMGNYCHLASNIIIGNDVMFASFVACVGGDHRIDFISGPIKESGRDEMKTTVIEDDVWVGHGVIIMHGVNIRKGAVIAAGSVVTKDVEENNIVGGNPARVIRKRRFAA